ncbi:hypothetical protein [uncultured Tyzzerella sp.]|uniref:DUF6630 family protein n=1 Tax=uncultured Tyzzerella sp. TaxID=2321398 RepID=UPI002943C844|nr:hypothetical protein [uncultured Tyzzerella sp.]
MKFKEKILKIVEIISQKSELKHQILENTKVLLDDYEKNKDDENDEATYWEYIVSSCLTGENISEIYEDLDEIPYNDFDEDAYLKAPLFTFDWKEYAEEYIGGLETLIDAQKLNITLKDIEYDNDNDDIENVSRRIHNKLKPLGYILTSIDIGSDEYEICILKEEDFNTIKNMIEEDEILSDVIILQVFGD